MALLDRLPSKTLTQRGWGFVLTGVFSLLLAQGLGRRDLLYVGVFLITVPLLSVLLLRLIKPRFSVERNFSPQTMETGSTTTVGLAVSADSLSGPPVSMAEQVPSRFGPAPQFTFPSRNPTRAGVSLYQYRLRSSARGIYEIGPVTADFTDPFGMGKSRHVLGSTSPLVVTPAALELLHSPLSGSRGNDGQAATRRAANPSDDDVMTREYRNGDSMRRVHWPATARHNELMVRQEESVTTPQATLLMDQRHSSFGYGLHAALGSDAGPGGMSTSPAFEWAVTAVASISAHLLERGYAVRFLDHSGDPALLSSPSAPFPRDEEFQGPGALASLTEGLAALGLAPDTGRRQGSTAVKAGRNGRMPLRRAAARREEAEAEAAHRPFGDGLLDKLAATRHRGPLIAVLGQLTRAEAVNLGTASGYGSAALALLIADQPAHAEVQLDILRAAGWQAAAVSPRADLPAVWAGLGLPSGSAAPTPARAGGDR